MTQSSDPAAAAKPSPRQIEARELEQIDGRERVTRLLCVLVSIAIMLGVGNTILAERGVRGTIELCNLQNNGSLKLAKIKRHRASLVVHGPDYQDRVDSLIDEAQALEKNAADRHCNTRFTFP